MLKSVSYQVTFPTTGRTFSNEIAFAPGLTTITGRNEAGKTLIREMISYALFGKAALRGAATDYKNLTVDLSLDVNGEAWQIARGRKESFCVNGEPMAVGADALNKEIPARLGFGLDVWNIACSAVQGDVEAFTNMKPTARRQMVDRLVNLDQLEAIERECKAEAKTAEAVALHLMMSNQEPVEPVKPEGYKPSEEIEEALRICHKHEQERLRLSEIREPVEPVAPDPVDGDVEELEAHEAARQAVLQEVAHLQGQLSAIPEPTVTIEELAAAVAYKEYEDEVRRRGPKPDVEIELLRDMDRALDVQQRAGDEVECPSCAHHFHLGVSSEEETWLDHRVPLTRAQITSEFRRHELWAEPLAEVPVAVIPNLEKEILAHARAADRTVIVTALSGLHVGDDRSGDLRAARDHRTALLVHEERLGRYAADLGVYRSAQELLASLGDRSGEVSQLQATLALSRAYDVSLRRYSDESARYERVRDEIRDSDAKATGFKAGGDALKNVRFRVKQHLVPSLSKAASSLLAMMTDGERQQVLVDEDFNVLVDGQPVNTLSGSGKSVVNLALRIGLGQVLTSSIMPIFLGDEIDAAMDADRADSTLKTMQNLKQYLKQIILITHKDLEADTVIRV